MSTDFLNRRMDLKHTSLSENYLTMDTSYPVKLAGKVVKIFTASSNFNTNKWILENSDREIILTVESDNVYDFAGRVIKNSIGAGKAYSENINVFKQDDYVMVIIDFDNKNLHLCSQTNFENFIVGVGDKCEFKLFDITGESEMPGYEYKINEEIFDSAAEFENEEGCHSFVRHSDDDVVYEIPSVSEIEEDEENEKIRKMIPVAKTENIDINRLNASVQPVMILTADYDNDNATDILDFSAFMTISGAVNDKFIEDFCFTNNELINSEIFKTAPESIKSEYNTIEDKDKYYYILASYSENNQYSSNEFEYKTRIIPINKETNSFSTYFEIPHHGFVSNGKRVEMATDSNQLQNTVGTKDKNMAGYLSYHYAFSLTTWNYNKNTDKPKIIFDNGGGVSSLYNDYIENGKKTGYSIIYDNNYTLSYEFLRELCQNDLPQALKFIDFFNVKKDNKEEEDNMRKEYIRYYVLSHKSSSNEKVHLYSNDGGSSFLQKCPVCMVVEYPEIFEDSIFNSDTDITNYELNIDNFDRTKLSFEDWVKTRSKYENMRLLHYLMNNETKEGYSYTSQNKHKDCNLLLDGNFVQSSNYKFKSSHNLGNDSYITMINKNKYICSFVNKVCINDINNGNIKTTNSQFLFYKEINFANSNIIIDDDSSLKINVGDNQYQLYLAYNEDSLSIATASNFKKNPDLSYSEGYDNKNVADFCFMYYLAPITIDDNEYIAAHRIKYFYKNKDSQAIEDYDYYTDNVVMTSNFEYTLEDLESDELYVQESYKRAYINRDNSNATANEIYNTIKVQYNYSSDKYQYIRDILMIVANSYGIYPGFYGVIKYKKSDLISTDTCNLTVSIDERIVYPCGGDRGPNSNQEWRLKDVISNYTINGNPCFPFISGIKENNTSIFNIKSYITAMQNNSYWGLTGLNDDKLSKILDTRKYGSWGLKAYTLLKDALVQDLATSKKFDTIETSYLTLFKKSLVSNIKLVTDYKFDEDGYRYPIKVYRDKDSNETVYLTTDNDNGITLHSNINPNDIFGFNKITLEDYNNNDITDTYAISEKIVVNKNTTGLRETYSVGINETSMDDELKSSIVPIDGNVESSDIDVINWRSLLLSLNNNKTLDILGPLLSIKKEIRDKFINAEQNINDNVSIEDNVEFDATNIVDKTNAYGGYNSDGTPKRPEYDKYRSRDKDGNITDIVAEFNEETNLYEFNDGYGYSDPNFVSTRYINNRGVIVFVSDGGYSTRIMGSGKNEYDNYQSFPSSLHAKRMYISKDGLICTKEYFERENATSDDSTTTIKELQKIIDNLTSTIESLAKSGGMTNFKIMRDKISSAMTAVLSCHYAMAYKVNDGSWLVDIKSYYRNMQYIYENIDDYTKEVYNCNYTLNNLLALHHPHYAKEHTSSTDEVFEKLNKYNSDFYDAVINEAEALADKKTNFITSLKTYMNYIVDNLTTDVAGTSPNISDIKNTISKISFE